MKWFKWLAALTAGLVLALLLIAVFFPRLPGELILAGLKNRLPPGLELTALRPRLAGGFLLERLMMRRPEGELELSDLDLVFPWSLAWLREAAVRLQVEKIRFERPGDFRLRGGLALDAALHLSHQDEVRFRLLDGELLGFPMDGEVLTLLLDLQTRLRYDPAGKLWTGDATLEILDGRIDLQLEAAARTLRLSLKTGQTLVPAALHRDSPLVPWRIEAEQAWLTGEILLGVAPAEGELEFRIGAGRLLTRETTAPVSLYPTGFGEIPTQLGLGPELSSQFSAIHGRLTTKSAQSFIELQIDSAHYALTLKGCIERGHFRGDLVLALPPQTLAGNRLGLQFRRIADGDHFNIYGVFSGPLDDVAASWDLDRQKLLEGAADGLKQKWMDFWN